MAIIHADGFGQYGAYVADTGTHTLSSLYAVSSVRLGTNYAIAPRVGVGLTFAVESLLLTLGDVAAPTYPELWMGATVRLDDGSFSTSEHGTIQVRGPLGSRLQARFYKDGSVRFFIGNNTAIGTASAPAWYPRGAFFRLEAYFKIHDTTGMIEVSVNGQTHSFSGDTADVVGEVSISQFEFRCSVDTFRFSDLVLDDAAYVGTNVAVDTIFPDGNGFSVADLVQVGGAASKWQSVNERPHDSDTTAVDITTVGQRGLFTMGPNLAAGVGTILAVSAYHTARKTDAGSATLATQIRSGGTEATVGSTIVADSFRTYEHIMLLNPVTAAPWTVAEVDALEVGLKRI